MQQSKNTKTIFKIFKILFHLWLHKNEIDLLNAAHEKWEKIASEMLLVWAVPPLPLIYWYKHSFFERILFHFYIFHIN